jgi:hypothetical protein
VDADEQNSRLYEAARAGDLETVTSLLRAGASAVARDARGLSAIDHALAHGHTKVALELERAAVAGQPYEGLFRAVIDWNSRIELESRRIDIATRNAAGLTPLVLAARYRLHQAMRDLVASGAALERRALLTSIEIGDLDGLRLLLDLGANMLVEPAAILRAACAQPDSDLVKELLLRGIDVGASSEPGTLHGETGRLLRNARAGHLPPAAPTVASRSDCPLCRELPDSMGWCRSANGDHTGDDLPAVTDQFETFGWAREGVWKCPHCGTYHAYEMDHDNGIPDGWDSEYLRRITDAKALELLRAMTPEPRIEREIAALSRRLTFDEAVAGPGRRGYLSVSDEKSSTRWVNIMSLGDDGAKHLAERRVPESEHAGQIAALAARGLELIETDHPSDFVWVRTVDGVEVFDDERKVLHVAGDRATLADGRVIARADLARVIAFAEDGGSYRGLKAVLRSGEEVTLVSEYSSAAAAAAEGWPTYSRNELIWETGWCSILGRLIASWAGAELVDLI